MTDAELRQAIGDVHPRDLDDQARGRACMLRGELTERRAVVLLRDIDLVAAVRRASEAEDHRGIDILVMLRWGRVLRVQVKTSDKALGTLPSRQKRRARGANALLVLLPFDATDHLIRRRLRKAIVDDVTPKAPSPNP